MFKVQILRREREVPLAAGKGNIEVTRPGVIPQRFTKVPVDYLHCIPQQFHITKLLRGKIESMILRYKFLQKCPVWSISAFLYMKHKAGLLCGKQNDCVKVDFTYDTIYNKLRPGITGLLII